MPTLLYCPMLYHHDKGMWPPVISSTSYFLWQKNLWDIFQELKEWRILWNAGQPNSNLYDPVQNWNSTNIQYTKMSVKKALKKCDRVLVDIPSTVMWDAKKTGKPCLCLTWNDHWLRKDTFKKLNIKITNQIFVNLQNWLSSELRITIDNTKFIGNQNDWLKEILC